MADIAIVFHWPPNVMDDMPLNELMNWWNEAKERATPENEE